MLIVVEYSSEVLGSGVFWHGKVEDIDQIHNIPARDTARQVAKDGKPRKCGMWSVRAITPPQEPAMPDLTQLFDMPPKPCCENCEGLYDDSDGPEYGPPCLRCDIKPHMENLKGFPFRTPQRCFEPHWTLLVDWEKEYANA